MMQIVNIRENTEWRQTAADFISTLGSQSKQDAITVIDTAINTSMALPRWYLLLDGDRIVASFGLTDWTLNLLPDPAASVLRPWLTGISINAQSDRQNISTMILEHARTETIGLGFEKLYITESQDIQLDEDWRYHCDLTTLDGKELAIYEANGIIQIEEMAAFFNARADFYDSHMLDDLDLDEFYLAVDRCFDSPARRLLDLGCGTGLELARLFDRFPNMSVTGIDLSQQMLALLHQKFPDKQLDLICGSFTDVQFEQEYDHVLSTYALHHFNHAQKLTLYSSIHAALLPGGRFILGDYVVPSKELETEFLAESERLRHEKGIAAEEFIHFDTPLTVASEISLLKAAGFSSVDLIKQWENTVILVAWK
ncbi:MAG: methyltransferase domain-containing protein [Coriobacteriales bacterium]|jgi:tRNA (cmo5U34)-methyltransferase|nr:methyltransferase domain-containing protein [Coriobacteriales bacterium]